MFFLVNLNKTLQSAYFHLQRVMQNNVTLNHDCKKYVQKDKEQMQQFQLTHLIKGTLTNLVYLAGNCVNNSLVQVWVG